MTTKYEMQFCVGCYLDEAVALTRSILETSPHDETFSLTLVPGAAGSFEVKKDGSVVFSKKRVGRLPTGRDLGVAERGTDSDPAGATAAEKCC
jgi:selT/selW/selH-like putative selenoprotein